MLRDLLFAIYFVLSLFYILLGVGSEVSDDLNTVAERGRNLGDDLMYSLGFGNAGVDYCWVNVGY